MSEVGESVKIERIYIVDDDEFDQYIIKRCMAKIGLNVETKGFSSAEEFLEFVDAAIEDRSELLCNMLVTMDLRMPGMGGLKALGEIKNRLDAGVMKNGLVFVLTSSGSEDDISRVSKFEFVRKYVTKPLSVDVVREVLGC